MRIILQVTSGPSLGRRIPLQDGEIARFGRSDLADVCFPDDLQMSGVHFELECRSNRCLVRDLQSDGGTLLNEQPVTEASLHSGDRILAGQTTLLTAIQSTGADGADTPAQEEQARLAEDSIEKPPTLAELCLLLELEEASQQLLQPEHSPETFVETLVEHRHFPDAIRLLSFVLPKAKAVWWAYRCVHDLWGAEFSEHEQGALAAALKWVQEPTEDHRRAATAAAELAEFQSAPSWVALAAFWSEGSLAPPELPVVAPDQRLTSQAVLAALLMTGTRGDVTESRKKFESIVKSGQGLLDDAQPWGSEA